MPRQHVIKLSATASIKLASPAAQPSSFPRITPAYSVLNNVHPAPILLPATRATPISTLTIAPAPSVPNTASAALQLVLSVW